LPIVALILPWLAGARRLLFLAAVTIFYFGRRYYVISQALPTSFSTFPRPIFFQRNLPQFTAIPLG
jgi:hypothetical protein